MPCLLFILNNLSSVYDADRERLIIQYVLCGYAYSLIISFLYFVHRISVSLCQLKRILKCLNLGRRCKIDCNVVRQTTLLIRVSIVFGIICTRVLTMWCLLRIHQKELQGCGSLLGYRTLWRGLQNQHRVYVPGARDIIHCCNNYIIDHNHRDLVMRLLADIAPGDSHQRRQHRLTRRV